MKFWPLIIAILGAGYYAAWTSHWWFPTSTTVLIGLLFWALGWSVGAIIIAALLTAIISPLLFAIGMLLFIRLR